MSNEPTESAAKDRLDVFTIVARDSTRPFWVRVGTAFRNKDGSLNLYLDALPVNGKLQVRQAERREPEAANA